MKKVLALFALLALTACSGQPVNGPTAATADSQATQEQADPAALTIGLTYIPDVQFLHRPRALRALDGLR